MPIFFSPVFKIEAGKYYKINEQLDVIGVDFPYHNSALFHRNLLHADIVKSYEIILVTSDDTKTYGVPVYIYERKTGLTKDKLAIQMID